jgi:hypothetical protein
MWFLRSSAAIIVGVLLAFAAIGLIESVSGAMHPPPDGFDWQDQAKVKEYVESLPTESFAILLAAYFTGSLLGGFVAALIAPGGRTFHAGIIGALVLAATTANFAFLKYRMAIDHPDWVIVAGLLIPLPTSLIAGAVVSKWKGASKS